MADIEKIITAIDEFLEQKHQKTTTPVEINPFLEKKGLLNDSSSRPGLPIRKILRKGQIKHAYQIGMNWFIPHSGKTSSNTEIEIELKTVNIKHKKAEINSEHKLKPIVETIIELIEKKYKKKPNCYFEYKPDWLLSFPTETLIKKRHELINLYSRLVDGKYLLKEKLKELTNKNYRQKQSFDIWIGEPFNYAVEFDEKQHFNQFRKITLGFYGNVKIKYPLNYYIKISSNSIINPGKSGFTKLKSKDPLFPEMYQGEKQDNRIRQRAFRDFLKDILPIENNYNPTLRIPYNVTNNKRNDFNNEDLKKVKEYITKNELI